LEENKQIEIETFDWDWKSMNISIGTNYLSVLFQSLSTDHFNNKLNGDLKI
jgi:hypothetical protein